MKKLIQLLSLAFPLTLTSCNDTIEPAGADPVCLPTVFSSRGIYDATFTYQADKVVREEWLYTNTDPVYKFVLEFAYEPGKVITRESKYAPATDAVEFIKTYRATLNADGWVTSIEEEQSPGQFRTTQKMYYNPNGTPLACVNLFIGRQDSLAINEYTDRTIRKYTSYTRPQGQAYQKNGEITNTTTEVFNPTYKSEASRFFGLGYFSRYMIAQQTIKHDGQPDQTSCLSVFTTNEKGFVSTLTSCGIYRAWQYDCKN